MDRGYIYKWIFESALCGYNCSSIDYCAKIKSFKKITAIFFQNQRKQEKEWRAPSGGLNCDGKLSMVQKMNYTKSIIF